MNIDMEVRLPRPSELLKIERRFLKAIDTALENERRYGEKKLRETHSTWNQHPDWEKEDTLIVSGDSFDLEKTIFTTSTPYVFVAVGTKDRAAVFSIGYTPKTKKGRIAARSGSGRVVAKGIKARQMMRRPKKIDGRAWHYLIAEKQEKRLVKNIRKVNVRYLDKGIISSDIVVRMHLTRGR